jgi:hypothetical protein
MGGVTVYPVGLHAAVWFGSGADLPQGGINAYGAPISPYLSVPIRTHPYQLRRPQDIANHSGYSELWRRVTVGVCCGNGGETR